MASSLLEAKFADKKNLWLSINKKTQKVLYAKAQKESVDFLFQIFSLPLGTVMRLLREHSLAGSLGNLYKSIEKLDNGYMLPSRNKGAILNPKLANHGAHVPLLSFPNEDVPKVEKLYVCSNSLHSYVSDDPKTHCPTCYCRLSKELSYMAGLGAKELTAAGGGFVKDLVAYMITDDLEVTPWSTVSTLASLSKVGVEEVDDLEEIEVSLGTEEGLMLLKASFECKEVLTTVFMAQ